MINLTDSAASKVKQLLQKEKEGASLRLAVQNVGCAGFSYDLKFDTQIDPKMDKKFDEKGVPIVVDKKSLLYVDGTTIDFSQSLMSGGFKFKNPIATDTCSCGTSFST